MILILLYIVLIWRCFHVCLNAPDRFGMLLSGGITIMIGLQVVLNIAVVTSSMPPDGHRSAVHQLRRQRPLDLHGGIRHGAQRVPSEQGKRRGGSGKDRKTEIDREREEEGQQMRVIVTGGGTGGHIYPAIAIADKVMEKDPEAEVLYIGNDIGLEKDIVPRSGYKMELVSAKWLDRRNILKVFDTGLTSQKGVAQAYRIMKKFRPDVVIGTGGFVCVPVMYAGHKYGAPLLPSRTKRLSGGSQQDPGKIRG